MTASSKPIPPARLTLAEREVLDKLAEAWNLWLQLETLHPEETTEFRQALHATQYLVMARPVRRQFAAESPAPVVPDTPDDQGGGPPCPQCQGTDTIGDETGIICFECHHSFVYDDEPE